MKFPGASHEALDLLSKILVFNPYFRWTVNQALDHPFFKQIRKPELEVSALNEIEVEFDDKKNKDLTRDQLRAIFLKEIALLQEMKKRSFSQQ